MSWLEWLGLAVVCVVAARVPYYYGAGTAVEVAPFWKVWDWKEKQR